MADATAEDFLRNFKRERKSAEIEGVGTIYFYDPPTVAEAEAYFQHIRLDEHGRSMSIEGIVEGIIARVKGADNKPLFRKIHRSRLIDEMSVDKLLEIWRAIGGEQAYRSTGELAEAAEKK